MALKAAKISVYAWEGTDRQGARIAGELSGNNPALIKAQLRKQGIKPGKVQKKTPSLFTRGKHIKAQDIALFTRQLATMMKAGVPLLQSFDIIGEGFDNPVMRKLVEELKQDVAAGSSLAAALRRKPQHFDELYCNLVDAGEQAGALDTLLERVATYKEKSERLKARIKKAMTYPAVVVLVAVIVTAILLVKVVPQFESMFKGFGTELPAFTQMIISLSRFMQAQWWMLLGVLIAVIFGVRHALRASRGFREQMDRWLLKLPLVGTLMYKSAVARFARTLSTTFAAGVPLVEALDSVAGATGNSVFKAAVSRVRQDVAAGMQLNFSMRATGVFPNMAIQMTAIGEESGALDDMLDKVADFHEAEVDNLVDNLTSLMEPFIMVVLGVIVGGLVVAMYLPVFQLGSAI
ncbi:type II secretion system F family protein [Pseudomonas vancouverensis]|uniref:Type II secretion system F family protein n=1 Tax=Pseudomonas vancouverensis TaxID=95300 RepID=A0A1H2PJ42_PSEVA|nr:type II secretion system F family protein [Pseudomonas vancouverensis]KAB0492554.1 type II secretion system F family protein [Pseudomonas vancouverensis]TDB58496.1 type II secretion system F family protein [Pseudomonas vancouverensis]SDV17325.1 type IV pilus assembly protein PilC [Pseudomonas vancouverensis]